MQSLHFLQRDSVIPQMVIQLSQKSSLPFPSSLLPPEAKEPVLDAIDSNPKDPTLSEPCLVIYRIEGSDEHDVGRPYNLPESQALTIGTHVQADIQVPPDPLFPCSVRLAPLSRGGWGLENLEKHNNIQVNQILTRSCCLKDGDLIKVSAVTFRFLDGEGEESQFYQRVFRLIGTDVLTGISNRRQLRECLLRSLAYCYRNEHPFNLVMIDVDNFRVLNNTYGHAAGDFALRQLIERIQKNIRAHDTIGREGGEEFLLGLPKLTHAEAIRFVDRLRKRVTEDPIVYEGIPLTVTFSAGVSTRTCLSQERGEKIDLNQEIEYLKREADQKMYEAKQRGKNQVL